MIDLNNINNNNNNYLIFIFNESNIFKSKNKNGEINYYINDNIVNNNYYIKHKKIRNYIEYKYGNRRIYNSCNYNRNDNKNNVNIKNEKFENFDIYRLNDDELNDFNSFILENSKYIYSNTFYNIDKFIIFKDSKFNDILNFFIAKNIAYFKTRKINYFNIYSFAICYSNKSINQTKEYNAEFKNNINSNDITNEIIDDIISSAEKLNCYNCYFYENNNNNVNNINNNIIFHFKYDFNYYSREKLNNMMKKILDGSEKFKEYMKENGLKNTNNQTKYIK